MGRPDRPVDPNEGPVQQFAHDLRVLRQGSGNPTYATMARCTGLSKEALSAAARGYSLASRETVLAFVTACGGDVVMWDRRYRETRALVMEAGEARAPRTDPVPEPTDAQGAGPAEPAPPTRRRFFTGRFAIVATLLSVLVAVEGVRLTRDQPIDDPVRMGAEVDSSAPLAAMTFGERDCDHWWPNGGQPSTGWSYRACLRRDPADVSSWRAGAQVRNLGTATGEIEVYVSWVSVPAAGGANRAVGHQSLRTGPVPPGETRQVIGPRYTHPGAALCTWAEIAPLMSPKQRWSDSPKRDEHGSECRLD